MSGEEPAGQPAQFTAACLEGTPHGFFGRFPVPGEEGMTAYRATATDRLRPGASLAMPRQTHSAICLTVTERWNHAERPEGDALATDRPGVVLGIVTADCAPVLLADREAGVIAAAHAGWRGALGGVIANTVAAMERLGARRDRVAAAIGPAIGRASYEVDEGLRARFPDKAQAFFTPGRLGHHQFNLPAYVAHRLREAGVGTVEDLAVDTYANPEFYSYRRATHQGRPDAGRQISAIALE